MKPVPGRYEFLPHTADAKFRAHGKTLEEAFENAARATTALITDIDKVKPAHRVEVDLSAKGREQLLFDFLDQVLYLIDTEGLLLSDCEDMEIVEEGTGEARRFRLRGTLLGDHYRNYETHGDVKAVTYNDMAIERLPDGKWVCQVVVDL